MEISHGTSGSRMKGFIKEYYGKAVWDLETHIWTDGVGSLSCRKIPDEPE